MSDYGKLTMMPRAALIDMDGVLYDSMPLHADAWMTLMAELGIDVPRELFFRLEGMTGAATLRHIFGVAGLPAPSDEEIHRLYMRKSELFKTYGERKPMPGARRVIDLLLAHGVTTVLVTGSGQKSLLDKIEADYPGAFPAGRRVTAEDVVHGKPDPEPYILGLGIAGASPADTIVIENAPLGVKAGAAAGCLTIGVNTGPLEATELLEAGADMVFPGMDSLAGYLQQLPKHDS